MKIDKNDPQCDHLLIIGMGIDGKWDVLATAGTELAVKAQLRDHGSAWARTYDPIITAEISEIRGDPNLLFGW